MQAKSRSRIDLGIDMSEYDTDARCESWSPYQLNEQRQKSAVAKEKLVVKSLLK